MSGLALHVGSSTSASASVGVLDSRMKHRTALAVLVLPGRGAALASPLCQEAHLACADVLGLTVQCGCAMFAIAELRNCAMIRRPRPRTRNMVGNSPRLREGGRPMGVGTGAVGGVVAGGQWGSPVGGAADGASRMIAPQRPRVTSRATGPFLLGLRRAGRMLEAIVAVCRALACDARLLALYALSAGEELASKEIAERVALVPSQASRHLSRLSGVGLLRPRRSGAHVYYQFLPDELPALAGEVAPLVVRACRESRWATRGWREREILHLAPDTVARLRPGVARSLDVVFDAATAFGNVRRLQVLRLLLRSGPCGSQTVGRELRMSPWACVRHLGKLWQRGYVRLEGPGLWGVAAGCRTAFHSGLLDVVAGRLA